MPDNWFYLSKAKIKWLFRYYLVLISIGLPTIVFALIGESISLTCQLTITEISLIGSTGTALTGCAIFYLRKLYKANINREISPPVSEDEEYRQFGIFAYYFLRPIFSIVFSLLIHILLKSSVHIITVRETRLDEGFIYLNMVLSFFAGFASGDVITIIEEKSKHFIASTFNRHL